MIKYGMVGLPNVGKSTLFNAFTNQSVSASNYPFCTIKPNIGNVVLHDSRLLHIANTEQSKKVVPIVLEFTDIAGLVEGASEGKGMGNQFLQDISSVDVLINVVRCFDSHKITHVNGIINPVQDLDLITLELIMHDLKIADGYCKSKKTKDIAYYKNIHACLARGKTLYSCGIIDNSFITSKKMLVLCNGDHTDVAKQRYSLVHEHADAHMGAKSYMLHDLVSSDLHKILLDIHNTHFISYFTASSKESRAWSANIGCNAVEAAASIHTDFYKKFIRGNIINFKNYKNCKSMLRAKSLGMVQQVSKNHIMEDGDIAHWLVSR